MPDHLQVELVAADRIVWSGEASMIIARTVDGDIGVLRGHAPVLSALAEAVVEITDADGSTVVAVADGGFLSVAGDRVSILSEFAALSDDIDVEKARADLEDAKAGNLPDGADQERAIRSAEARIAAAERDGESARS